MCAGAVGVIFPILPTTPFVLLAAICFSAGSSKIAGWLRRNRIFGPYIENYRTKQGISKILKTGSVIFVWAGLLISMAVVQTWLICVILLIVGVGVTIHLLMIKTKKNEGDKKMSGNQKFFICKHCGNMMGLIENKGVPVVCCGEKMTELVPNTVEASVEKHLPVVTAADGGISVQVGSVLHPMEENHHIVFIYVETERGGQRKNFNVGESPVMTFSFIDDKPVAVYAYCNIHGLWKTEI